MRSKDQILLEQAYQKIMVEHYIDWRPENRIMQGAAGDRKIEKYYIVRHIKKGEPWQYYDVVYGKASTLKRAKTIKNKADLEHGSSVYSIIIQYDDGTYAYAF